MNRIALCLPAALLASCSATRSMIGDGDAHASDAQFKQLSSLAGDWVGTGGPGAEAHTIETRWRVTAGGSAVEETLFAGTPHEMVSVFHRNGDALLMTHYCAVGNQPRMRSISRGAGAIEFDFVDATNLANANDLHMAHARFELMPDGTLKETWTANKDGKVDHSAEFTFHRKP